MSYLYKSTWLRILEERGFLYQVTHPNELDDLCQKKSISAYWGCDATAPSLHVGNLMGLMAMRWMLEFGHRPILLIGGGTTKIGDPSGRNSNRQLLSQEIIDENKKGILQCFTKIIPNDQTLCLDNAQWLDSLTYIPFLRDIGVHFSVNRMLSAESIKGRLDRNEPLSFIEFNYMLLQSYDFLEIFKKHGCILQIGGSEQWGNIVAGIDLIRRMTQKQAYGLTWPLLQNANGAKMGKTAQGALWLHEDQTKPYDYWQFWRNVDDRDVVRFLKIYTMVPLKDINDVHPISGQEWAQAKIFLADKATEFLHGEHALKAVHHHLKNFAEDRDASFQERYRLSQEQLENGVLLVDILVSLGFLPTKTQARQKILEGGLYLEEERVSDTALTLNEKSFKDKKNLRVRFGQKKRGWISNE